MTKANETATYALPLLTTDDPHGALLLVKRVFTKVKVTGVMFEPVRAPKPTVLLLDTPKYVREGDRFVMRVPPAYVEVALMHDRAILLTESWSETARPACPTCNAPAREREVVRGVETASVERAKTSHSVILAPSEMISVQHDGIVGQVIGFTFSTELLCASCLGEPLAPAPKKRAAKCAACGGVAPKGDASIVVTQARVGKDAEIFEELPAFAVAPGMIRLASASPGMLVTISVKNASKHAVRLSGSIHVDGPALADDWDAPFTVAKKSDYNANRGGLVTQFPTEATHAQIYRADTSLAPRS